MIYLPYVCFVMCAGLVVIRSEHLKGCLYECSSVSLIVLVMHFLKGFLDMV